MARSSLRQGSSQSPSLLAAIWVGGCALGVGFLACLLTLLCIQCHLEKLQGELSQLRGEMTSKMHGAGGDWDAPKAHQSAGHLLERPPPYTHLERRIRDAGRNSQKPQCQRKKQSVLHLVPIRPSNSDIEFATEVWWKPFLQLGRALELSGRDVLVKHTGLYFIYSQVLFHDPTFTMGQLLRRLAPGRPEQILFRCVQSMPQTPVKAYNSCYSGGIFHLQHGDRLNLRIPRFNASFDISDHGTFLGLLRL